MKIYAFAYKNIHTKIKKHKFLWISELWMRRFFMWCTVLGWLLDIFSRGLFHGMKIVLWTSKIMLKMEKKLEITEEFSYKNGGYILIFATNYSNKYEYKVEKVVHFLQVAYFLECWKRFPVQINSNTLKLLCEFRKSFREILWIIPPSHSPCVHMHKVHSTTLYCVSSFHLLVL